MHVPQRAGAAEFREREGAGRKPFRDVAGIVHAQQEERHAARVRSLQRGETVADLLEAGTEAARQHLQIVAKLLGGGEERLIRHHHRRGIVVGEGDAIEPPRGVVERPRAVADRIEQRAAFGKAELDRKLEDPACRIDHLREQHLAAMAIPASQCLAHHVHRHDPHRGRMAFAQPLDQRGEQVLRGNIDFVAQRLGGGLQFGEIVAVGLDQVAHAFNRVGLEPRARCLVAVGELRRHHGFAAPRLGVGSVEALQSVGDAGAKLGEIAQFLFRQIDLAKQRIGENLVELGEESVLIGSRKIAQIEVIGLGEAQQNLRRHRTLVALDQVDVARRQSQPFGDLGL